MTRFAMHIPIREALALLIIATLSACATTDRHARSTFTLDMFIEQDDSSTFYRVSREGTIGYAGAYDARLRRITWTDQLAEAELQSLESLLQLPFWGERRRDSGRPDAGERRIAIDLRTAGFHNRIVVRGEPPEEVASLETLLRTAAMRRLEPDLQTLPKPGQAPQ